VTARTKYLTVLLAFLALVASGCGDEGTTDTKGTKDTSAKASPSAESGACEYLDSGQQPAKKVQKPPATPVADGPVEVTIKTNFGDMPATLDGKKAPCAVNSFLSLSKQGYYDKTDCHRITSNKGGFHVLQCGDPTGSGSGDPGYRYAEELTGQEDYRVGSLALANTGQPGSSGAQFFINYDVTTLPPNYTQFGQLTPAGLKVAQKAAKAATKGKPDGYDGPPATKVTITGVTQQ
jgi:peptidyl-prolyl cis-trans isomerase B (cyclophilin B)